MAKKIKENISLFFRGWIGSILIAVLVATSIKSAIADWYVVPTGSMKPTIVEGDRIFANKLAYDLKVPYTTWHIAQWDNPKRGDIVVFNSPADDKCLVKRVIGLPGDSIAMRNNQLFINGEAVNYGTIEQDYFESVIAERNLEHLFFQEDLLGKPHAVMITPLAPSPRSFTPVIVPEGHYFMMGDNRDNSLDSRYIGFIKREEILGRAISIVISLDKDHHYKPRWERFFTKLP